MQTYGLKPDIKRPSTSPLICNDKPYTSPALVAQISRLADQRAIVPCSNAELPDLVELLRQRGKSQRDDDNVS